MTPAAHVRSARRTGGGSGWKGPILLAALVLGALPAPAIDYEPSSLQRMLGLAELVVRGEVEEVLEESIVAIVDESLGEAALPARRIEIVRYEQYDRGGGRASYEPGQEFVWLLSWRTEPATGGAPPRWHVFGAEGEGELPVSDGAVYLRQELVDHAAGEESTVHGRKDRFVEIDLPIFWDAAAGYRRCVVWEKGTEHRSDRARTTCPEGEMEDYANRSTLHGQLARKTGEAGASGRCPSAHAGGRG